VSSKPARSGGPANSAESETGLLEKVQAELDLVRPAINDDGGDVELVGVEEGTVRIRFKGACIRCPSSEMTLRHGIERHLTRRVPGIRKVVAVDA
jgi:Fe-S cluster biogenesis protein NfuA